MATRRATRGVSQRHLVTEPEPPPADAPSVETQAPEPSDAPSTASGAPSTPKIPVDEPEGGADALLRERQRRWLAERDRFEEAGRSAKRSGADAPDG